MSRPSEIPSPPPAEIEALNRKLLADVLQPVGLDAMLSPAQLLRLLAAAFARDPGRWREKQAQLHGRMLALWASLAGARPGDRPSAVAEPPAGDRRFRAPEWHEIPYFSWLLQSYLIGAQWLREMVEAAPVEGRERRKLEFTVRQFIDAASPANLAWTNPEAIRLASESGGQSVLRGLENLAADLKKGMISMSDEAAFEVGRNLAATPGAVIYENDFMQLIRYRPSTPSVFARPLVIIPPCINKYYVLDLQPANSFVRHAVGLGHTVFMVSWRNMPPQMGHATWDDYLEHGVIRALDVAAKLCREPRVNALGFCVGGTLLGSALAVLRARNEDRVASVTLLATMLDFSDTGELGLFIDEAYAERCERDYARGGIFPGRRLAITFASLRANELIWRYVANNYLKGRTPDAFDFLYWNADSTNLPGPMYGYYIRNMYLDNNLPRPGRLVMCGAPVDLGKVDVPAYVLGTREDHIVPWRTAYRSARLLGGRIEFVLAASGHVAGVINPASLNRRQFWTRPAAQTDPDAWLAGAECRAGSWWNHWGTWLEGHGGRRRAAPRRLGNARYREIEPAPGRYVRERA